MRSSGLKIALYCGAGVFFLWTLLSLHSSSSSSSLRLPISIPTSFEATRQRFKAPSQPARQELPKQIKLAGAEFALKTSNTSSSSLQSAWENAWTALSAAATASLEKTFSEQDLAQLKGFPGTSIRSSKDAASLQAYLDCTVSQGAWVYDPEGQLSAAGLTAHKQSAAYASCDKKFYKGKEANDSRSDHWDVRESLKYRWQPDTQQCSALLPAHLRPSATFTSPKSSTLPARETFCQLLHYKYLLLAGDQATQFYLHDLLLDWTNDAQESCYGDLYCGMHSICGTFANPTKLEERGGARWQDDVLPFDRLGLSPQERANFADATTLRQKVPLSKDQQDYWTAMRYRRTDGLWLDGSTKAEQIDPVFIHPQTGVREINQYTFPDIGRSDLVILAKSPLPFPLPTSPWADAVKDIAATSDEQQRIKKVVELAVKLTKEVWLPEAVTALHHARLRASLENLVVWRGQWRMQLDCSSGSIEDELAEWWHATSPGDGPPPHLQAPTLQQVFAASHADAASKGARTNDVHAMFYNVQVVLQNALIRKFVLPQVGVPFLDMEAPMSVWRSGMLGGTSYAPSLLEAVSKPAARNCLEPCIPSAGMSAEEGFIGGLYRLMQSGWGNEEAESEWTGPNYVPLRKRT